MPSQLLLDIPVQPDWEEMVRTIRREGTPGRVHYLELFLDGEIKEAVCERFGLVRNWDEKDPYYAQRREIAVQRLLGYDYVFVGVEGLDFPMNRDATDDTAALPRQGGRSYMNEHRGPITSWEEFEAYPWPDPKDISTRSLDWYSENLPDDMCIIGSGPYGHFAEYLTWLMGYESLCYALYDQRDLVAALHDRILAYQVTLDVLLSYDRVKAVWGSDDMGFRSATLISADDLREFVLSGHKLMAAKAHSAGRLYLLHSCGNLSVIMEDLIEDVGIDAKHSFEDTIENVIEDKTRYGGRIALLGGIDVDFLCRADEASIRARVRRTLEVCQAGGGYLLGSGNSVANYIPLDHYLIMLDEGRRFGV